MIGAGMIEHGLVDSSSYRPKSSVSEELSLEESVLGAEEFVSVSVTDINNTALQLEGSSQPAAESLSSGNSTEGDNHLLKPPSRTSPDSSESDWETLDPSVLEEGSAKEAAEAKQTELEYTDGVFDSKPGTPITVQPQAAGCQGGGIQGLVSGLEEDQYGLPLPIFTKVTQSVLFEPINSIVAPIRFDSVEICHLNQITGALIHNDFVYLDPNRIKPELA